MKRFSACLISVLFLVVQVLFPSVALSAPRVDDIFDKYMSSGGGYFKSQQYGFFTPGGFSARVDYGTVNPISISLPKLRVGCGGIDLFWGGLGFANIDYLVQKFQNLIQMAPIVAFQIALNSLSPSIKNILAEVENIVNILNSLQLDECKLLKPFMTISLTGGNVHQQFEKAAEQALGSTGLSNLFNSMKNFWTSLKKSVSGGSSSDSGGSDTALSIKDDDLKKAVEDNCPGPIKDLWNQLSSGGSIVEHFVASKLGSSGSGILSSEDLNNVIKAFIGDMKFKKMDSSDKSGPKVIAEYIAPCDGVQSKIQEGKIPIATGTSGNKFVCNSEIKLSDLERKVTEILNSAYQAVSSKQSLPSSFRNLADSSPLNLYMLLRYSYMAKDPTPLISVAPVQAFYMFSNLVLNVMNEIMTARNQLLSALKSTSTSMEQCPLSGIPAEIEKFSNVHIPIVAESLNRVLQMKAREYGYLIQYTVNYLKFYEYAMNKVKSEFGLNLLPGLTRR